MFNKYNLLWIIPAAASIGYLWSAIVNGGHQFDGVPKNCYECGYRHTCNSWYGGSTCKFKGEIRQ